MFGNRKREKALMAAALAGTAATLLLNGCGNTWRGMGQDMEILGRRIQDSTNSSSTAPGNDYDYYRANPQPYQGAY